MNPNASTFVPNTKMDATEQRKYEQQHFLEQINTAKQDLAAQNAQLILLHSELNETYAALCSKEEKYSKHDIELLHSKYTQQSQIYYKQYSRFNDLTANIVTLQQKLHRLLLAPASTGTATSLSTPTTTGTGTGTDTGSDTTQHSQSDDPHMKGDNVSEDSSLSSPSSPSFTLLPPIMESDGESAEWNDCEKDASHLPAEEQIFKKQDGVSCIDNNAINIESDEKEHETIRNALDDPAYHDEKTNIHSLDCLQLERKINVMLDNIWNADIQSICNEFRDFIYTHSINCKTIEILINCIIVHAVNNKPVFFGAKYSLLCQSIFAYFNQLRDASKINANDMNLYELIWRCCYETFRKLQFGNNSEKFINIMIIIAELLNAKLLTSAHVFRYIFKGILCKNNAEEVCENDIEGIYEIFKRCAPSLTNKSNHNELNKYFMIMNNIKTWRKFQNGINQVPFMINEMQNIANNCMQ